MAEPSVRWSPPRIQGQKGCDRAVLYGRDTVHRARSRLLCGIAVRKALGRVVTRTVRVQTSNTA